MSVKKEIWRALLVVCLLIEDEKKKQSADCSECMIIYCGRTKARTYHFFLVFLFFFLFLHPCTKNNEKKVQ